MIARFLLELEDALPRAGRMRRRVLLEAADHLREAAAEAERGGASREEAEIEAVRRFGDARTVARSYARLAAATSVRRAVLVLTAGLALAVPVVYGLSENLLPPATWAGDELPQALGWKRNAMALLFGLSFVAAGLAYGIAYLGRMRLAVVVAASAAAALAVAVGFGTALAVEWAERVPGAGGAFVAAGAAAAALVSPAFVLGGAAASHWKAAR